jgi:hypothetical protein
MKIKLDKEKLFECIKFAVDYYLDERKSNINRTTGQNRGLGSVINDFVLGKFLEIGVAKAIESLNSSIKCKLDFEIHALNQDNSSDPDVIMINDNGKERKPKIFIEVKNISPNDRWIGLTQEQLNTIENNSIVDDDKDNLFLIYASLGTDNKDYDNDLLGIFLKSETKNDLFKKFSDISDVYCDIKYIISGRELIERGTKFNEGSYLYETEIIKEPIEKDKAIKIRKLGLTIIETRDFKLPIISRSNVGEFKEFEEFIYDGEIVLYLKKNEKSNRVYIDCKKDTTISNKVLGDFFLKNGEMYELFLDTAGRNPVLKRNNIWLANRRLSSIIKNNLEERLKSIAENI